MTMYVNNGSWTKVAKAWYKDVDNVWKLWYEPAPELTGPLISLSGELNAWSQRSIDMAPYGGKTGRLVFKYFNTNGFRGDIQLDYIRINGSYQSFESNSGGWQTTTATTEDYFNANFIDVSTGGSGGRWNRDSGGTGSNGTGRTDAANGSWYLYAETSVSHPYTFWLRSPEYTFTTSDIIFWEARYGSNIADLEVYLEI